MTHFIDPEAASVKYGYDAAISLLTVLEREAGQLFVSVGNVFSFWVSADEVEPIR